MRRLILNWTSKNRIRVYKDGSKNYFRFVTKNLFFGVKIIKTIHSLKSNILHPNEIYKKKSLGLYESVAKIRFNKNPKGSPLIKLLIGLDFFEFQM